MSDDSEWVARLAVEASRVRRIRNLRLMITPKNSLQFARRQIEISCACGTQLLQAALLADCGR